MNHKEGQSAGALRSCEIHTGECDENSFAASTVRAVGFSRTRRPNRDLGRKSDHCAKFQMVQEPPED